MEEPAIAVMNTTVRPMLIAKISHFLLLIDIQLNENTFTPGDEIQLCEINYALLSSAALLPLTTSARHLGTIPVGTPISPGIYYDADSEVLGWKIVNKSNFLFVLFRNPFLHRVS